MIEKTCPHCAKGNKPRWRSDTQEIVHDFAETITPTSRVVGHTICHDDPKWKAKQAKIKNG